MLGRKWAKHPEKSPPKSKRRRTVLIRKGAKGPTGDYSDTWYRRKLGTIGEKKANPGWGEWKPLCENIEPLRKKQGQGELGLGKEQSKFSIG